MANENVKVIIQEDNLTEPLGSGISSDIVYVPGFAVPSWPGRTMPVRDENGNIQYNADGTEQTQPWAPVRNKPTLCTTVEQFETLFGPEPYQFTDDDLKSDTYSLKDSNTSLNLALNILRPGDYDKSYIYAKELINAGLSVVYDNLGVSDWETTNEIVDVDFDYQSNPGIVNCNLLKYSEEVDEETEKVTKKTFTLAQPTVADNITSKAKDLEYNGKFDVFIKDRCPSPIHFEFKQSGTKINSNYNIVIKSVKPENTKLVKVQSKDCIEWTPEALNSKTLGETQDEKGCKCTVSFTVTISRNELTAIDNTATVQDETTLSSVYTTKEAVSFELCIKALNAGGDASLIDHFYGENGLSAQLDLIVDKSEYNIKYITSGGYPTFILDADNKTVKATLADKLMNAAESRGDAVALIDHSFRDTLPLNIYGDGANQSMYQAVNTYFSNATNGTFGTMFTPWSTYSCTTIDDPDRMLQSMPASFAYLLCLAGAIKTRPNWLAMAGVTRGVVPKLKGLNTGAYVLTNTIAEDYQPKYGSEDNKISINAITNIKPYGLTIWGNRTLEPVDAKGTTALNFLNTRNMISDIKKVAYDTARSLMFEQDSDVLWLRFKSKISPLLDKLKSGYGISNYKIIRNTTKYNGNALTRGELSATIKIFPLYAIEYFEITVAIADEDVAVS